MTSYITTQIKSHMLETNKGIGPTGSRAVTDTVNKLNSDRLTFDGKTNKHEDTSANN